MAQCVCTQTHTHTHGQAALKFAGLARLPHATLAEVRPPQYSDNMGAYVRVSDIWTIQNMGPYVRVGPYILAVASVSFHGPARISTSGVGWGGGNWRGAADLGPAADGGWRGWRVGDTELVVGAGCGAAEAAQAGARQPPVLSCAGRRRIRAAPHSLAWPPRAWQTARRRGCEARGGEAADASGSGAVTRHERHQRRASECHIRVRINRSVH